MRSPRRWNLNATLADSCSAFRQAAPGCLLETRLEPFLSHVWTDPMAVERLLLETVKGTAEGQVKLQTCHFLLEESRACLLPELHPGAWVRLRAENVQVEAGGLEDIRRAAEEAGAKVVCEGEEKRVDLYWPVLPPALA
jgi:hypothetical protein